MSNLENEEGGISNCRAPHVAGHSQNILRLEVTIHNVQGVKMFEGEE
jgi:hypothetical protein